MLCSRALHYMGWMHMFHVGPCLTALPFNSALTVSLMKVGLDWGPKHDAGRFHRVINATAEANELFDIVFVTTWRALCITTPQWESLPGCLTGLPAYLSDWLGCLPAWAQGCLTLYCCVSHYPWDSSSDRIPPLAQAPFVLPGLLHTDHDTESHFIKYLPYKDSPSPSSKIELLFFRLDFITLQWIGF